MDTPTNRSTEAWVCRRPCTEMIGIEGSCFFNTAAHQDVIQASCYPMVSKINCTTIVFKKFCITTRTRQGRSKPFLEREGFRFFVFGGVPAAQQKHPQRMTGLLQLRRSALRMLIFYAAPPLLMGKSGHRLRFDVIFRNTPAFLAPLCRATVEQSEIERFYPTSFLYALRTLLREMDLSGANWSLLFQSMMPASTHHCAALAVSGSATSTKAGVPMG